MTPEITGAAYLPSGTENCASRAEEIHRNNSGGNLLAAGELNL